MSTSFIFQRWLAGMLAACAMVCAGGASATVVKLDVVWSGADFGNTAVGKQTMVIDWSKLYSVYSPQPYDGTGGNGNAYLPGDTILAMSFDVSGATSGNGHFGLSDFWLVSLVGIGYFENPPNEYYDFAQQGASLMQAGLNGAPYSVGLNVMATDNGDGDRMQLTSIRVTTVPAVVAAPVPESETYLMLLLGLGMLTAVARRARG